jgi:hypothetical protein
MRCAPPVIRASGRVTIDPVSVAMARNEVMRITGCLRCRAGLRDQVLGSDGCVVLGVTHAMPMRSPE